MVKFWLVGMAVGGLALAGCAGGKESRRGEAAGMELEAGEKLEGVVVSVMGDTITVQSAEDGAIQLQRGDDTKVMRDDEMLEWSDISEGMPVRVKHEEERAAKVKILTGAEGQEIKSRVGSEGAWPHPEEGMPGEMPPPAGEMPQDGMPPPIGEPSMGDETNPESMGHDHDSHDSLDQGSIEE